MSERDAPTSRRERAAHKMLNRRKSENTELIVRKCDRQRPHRKAECTFSFGCAVSTSCHRCTDSVRIYTVLHNYMVIRTKDKYASQIIKQAQIDLIEMASPNCLMQLSVFATKPFASPSPLFVQILSYTAWAQRVLGLPTLRVAGCNGIGEL